MSKRFRSSDLNHPCLLPPASQDWLPADHLTRFIGDQFAGDRPQPDSAYNNGNVLQSWIAPIATKSYQQTAG